MGRRERPQFAVGAYWISKGGSWINLHGISLWQIIEKQSKGFRILEKVEQLEEGKMYALPNKGIGRTKQISCADLNKYKSWTYVPNPDTVRTLYGKKEEA